MSSDNDSFYSANSDVSNESLNSDTATLGDCVKQAFSCNSRSLFNVCHINSQSVPCHYSDLVESFAGANVHAILISESWLKPLLLSTSFSLPGFILIRNDRIGRRGGGVAIYLRSNFSFKILAASSPNYTASAEYLFLEVCVNGRKLVLGVVYCPPSVDYFSSLESSLESIGSEYTHHIIMGDFNTDLLSPHSSRSRKLLDIIQSASLHVLPLQATHHNTEGQDTWLDLILSSDPTRVSSHGQLTAPGFSHHDLLFLSYILKPPKIQPKVLYRRCFARIDPSSLSRDASVLSWESLFSASTVDDKVQMFNEYILNLYDTHAPIKKIKLKNAPVPWITCDIRTAMGRRDRAYRNFRKDRCDDKWHSYKAARNRCNQMIRNAKRHYISSNICNSSPADIWKFLGTLGIGKQRLDDCRGTVGLNDLNQHFTTLDTLDHQTKCLTVHHVAGLPRQHTDVFKFSPVGSDEIKKCILSIKSNAIGCDNISRRMIVPILEFVLLPISHIINYSLTSGSFPSLWRKAFVIPLPKVQNPSLPSHFRPISILPFLSKVLEACVHKQLSAFVFSNNILSPLQSGFRPGHSTTTALLKVTGDIRAGMEDTKVTVLALVDFSNAFNTVSHDILLAILSHSLVSSDALDWFSSYLRGRQQSVRLGESSSNWSFTGAGVPQGGILSPLLFSIFINLITHNLQCAYHLYADDLQLYSQAEISNISTAVAMINRDLEHIRQWSSRFGLAVNPSKCQATLVGSQRMLARLDTSSLPQIVFDSAVIDYCPTVKNLGLHIDSNLNWQSHVTNVSRKVTGSLRALYRLKNFLPCKTKTMLVQTLIFPLIDYGDVCYFDLNADLLNKLDRLLNNCIRFIFNLRKFDHVSTYRSQLKWLPIRQRRSMRALTTLFSILSSPTSPAYLTSQFHYLCNNHSKNLRSTNNLLLLCPSHNSDFVHSSFLVQSVLLWNALPPEIRMSTNRYSFKVKVRELVFKELAESIPQ